MKIFDSLSIPNWIELGKKTGQCLFCACEKRKSHTPFCIFEGQTTIVHSEQLSKWINGFGDGLNSERRRKDPYYLLGHKAGQSFKKHQTTTAIA